MLDRLILLAQAAADAVPADTAPATTQEEIRADTISHAYEYLSTQGLEFLLNLLAAAAIVLIGRWVAMFLVRLLRRVVERARVDPMLVTFLINVVYTLLLVVVILAAIDRLGINTTSFAALLAAIGLAVSLSLQGSLSNFASGVMIIFFKHFSIGNFVEAGGVKGVVQEIQIFHTVLNTFDNVKIIVPNNEITSNPITNYSANATRRIDLVVGCGYDDNLLEVKQFFHELIAADERILTDPPPNIAVDALADSSVNFIVQPWVNASDWGTVRWDLIEKIKLGFDERGFSIPFPQSEVHMHQESA